jgi:transmembrane sensor
MVMNDTLDPRDAALGWLVRTNDPEFEAWDEFTAWLERDPANADAYHALARSEAEMLPLVEAARPLPVQPRKLASRPYAWGSGLAAAAALLAVIAVPRVSPVEYETSPGEVRTVSLGGRDQLVMNGGTKVEIGGWLHRTVRLEQGQVLVALLEPGPSKVALFSGDLKLMDVGTVFEVARDGRDTRVLVSEGAVLADPDGARLAIDAGERLDTTDGANVLRAAPAEVSSVGSFQRGQLTYVDEPITHVVADLRRSTGLDISAAEAIRARRFTGTLSVAEVKHDPRSLGALLGVSIEPSGSGWELQGRS